MIHPRLDPAARTVRAEESPGGSAAPDDLRREWAVALVLAVAPSPLPVATGDGGSPAGWRRAAVPVTDLADAASAGDAAPARAPGGPGPAPELSRVETSVRTGALGEVRFTIDRTSAGVSIVIEVEGPEAARAVESERATLLRSLRLAGTTVRSFRILARPGAGPTLAGEASGNHARPRRRARSGEPGEPGEPGVDSDDPGAG